MNKSNTLTIFELLQRGDEDIKSIPDFMLELAHNRGLKTPFEVEFRNLFYNGPDYDDKDILILAGSPVKIILHDRFVLEWILGKKRQTQLTLRLQEALDRIHLLHRTLRHPVPLNKAKALRHDSKQWIPISPPVIQERLIKSNQLEISYTVKVFDPVTQISVSMDGTDPEALKRDAIRRISLNIFSQAELLDLMDSMEDLKKFKPEVKPSEITISGEDNGEFREGRKY